MNHDDKKTDELFVRSFNASAIHPPIGCPTPFRLPAEFDPSTPLDVEIGCGVGWHPVKRSLSHPDRFLIAIEHTSEKFEKFLARFESHGRSANLLPVHADAISWITHAILPGSVSRLFLMYPNPNPKNAAKRWMRMPFMGRLLESLSMEGELTLATNEADYADECRRFATEFWNLDLIRDEKISLKEKPGFEPRTHFELKYLGRGETCYELGFRKRADQTFGSSPK